MKLVKVLTKKVGHRNTKTVAECNPSNSVSVAFVTERPNMLRAMRHAAALS
jgi:hypothetical protein